MSTTSSATNNPPSFRDAWNEFIVALYSPTTDFNAFFWIFRLSKSLLNSLLYNKFKLQRLIPWLRPIIPFLGMTLTILCIWSYFSTFRYTIILEQWCNCSSSTSNNVTSCDYYCLWDIMHTIFVIFLGINIIGNYLLCAYKSPGFVVVEDYNNNNNTDLDFRFGGCCFFSSKMNVKSEIDRCIIYNQQQSIVNAQVEDDKIMYHPSPLPSHCKKCDIERPPRAHHCKVCKRCVLEYDHHCPWVNNCIGYNNYRDFILLLFYIIIGCAYGCCLLSVSFYTVMKRYIQVHGFKLRGAIHKTGFLDLPLPWILYQEYKITGKIEEDIVLRAVFPLLLAICIAMTCLLVRHIKLISYGYTTVEELACPSNNGGITIKNPFDLGKKKNFQRVLGTNGFFFPSKRR